MPSIWTLPPDDQEFSTLWRLIETWFSGHYEDQDCFKPNAARIRKKQLAIWQHRFWEHVLRDEQDFERHVDYNHYNPVKHTYVKRPIGHLEKPPNLITYSSLDTDFIMVYSE